MSESERYVVRLPPRQTFVAYGVAIGYLVPTLACNTATVRPITPEQGARGAASSHPQMSDESCSCWEICLRRNEYTQNFSFAFKNLFLLNVEVQTCLRSYIFANCGDVEKGTVPLGCA